MQGITNVVRLVEKMQKAMRHFGESYTEIASVTFLPTVEEVLYSVHDFERAGYLALIQNHDYSHLQRTLEDMLKMIQKTNLLVEGVRSTASHLIKSMNELELATISLSKKSASYEDSVRTIYEVFLDSSIVESPLLLFDTIVSEKIKAKRLSIKSLKVDIAQLSNENKINQLIYFLKHTDPYDKQSKRVRRSKSLSSFSNSQPALPHENLQAAQLRQLQKRLQSHGRYPEYTLEFLVDYYEYTNAVVVQLEARKKQHCQKMIDDEYFILRAKRNVRSLA
jgi:hypothetical protein